MKVVYERIRVDKDFNLETLTYQEMFDGLKFGIAKAISVFSKREVKVEDLELDLQRCVTKKSYGGDMNLYPKIYLSLKGNYSVLLTPFEIELIKTENGIKSLTCDDLNIALIEFMLESFPNCDYIEFSEKYQKNAQIIKKQREKHLFL